MGNIELKKQVEANGDWLNRVARMCNDLEKRLDKTNERLCIIKRQIGEQISPEIKELEKRTSINEEQLRSLEARIYELKEPPVRECCGERECKTLSYEEYLDGKRLSLDGKTKIDITEPKISFTTKGKIPFTDGNFSEPKTNWEEIIENEYYGEINKLSDSDLWRFCRGLAVKNIVSRIVQSQRGEAYEDAEKDYDEALKWEKSQLLSDIEKWVESTKSVGTVTSQFGLGYEAAQEDLIKFLDSLK